MRRRVVVGVAAAVAVAAAAPSAQAAPPKIEQLVVFKRGNAKQQLVKAAGTSVRVGGKRCAVASGTPLAGLLGSGLPGIRLKDYGSCSKRPADAAGLYVSRIRKDAAKGPQGWVYKVGNKVSTVGAGDTSGGLLKPHARVTWFYCRMRQNGCQRTLVVKPEALGGGQVKVTVRGYDDRGKAKLVRGATVHLGATTAKTDAKGVARVTTTPGKTTVYANANGLVRSFGEQIEVG
jgi:hypothetical protein